MPISSQRPLAPHVQAAIARGAQPKMAGEVGGGRPMAPHVQRAIESPIQAKAAGPVPGGRQMAPHVRRAIAGPMQPKAAGPMRGARQVAPTAIQREINYREGSRSWYIDPVDSLLQGHDFGVTPVLLNGSSIPPATNAARAVIPPDLRVETASAGTSVSIRQVATQNVSYQMELPESPPWSRRGVAKDRIKSSIEMQLPRGSTVRVPIEQSEPGTIDFEIKGLPDDDTFAQLVERHEKYHVNDLKETIQEILQPWDTMLQRLQDAGTRFQATNERDAAESLYRAAGGTPEEIGERFGQVLRTKGKAFHGTAAGSSPTIAGIQKSYFGGTLTVTLRHPIELHRWHARELRREREERLRRAALDRSARLWAARRAVGDTTIGSSAEGNRYILNEML